MERGQWRQRAGFDTSYRHWPFRCSSRAEAYAAASAEGAALSIDAAVAYATRSRGERRRPSSGWGSLTPTELDVARLAAQGLSNAEIGAKLFITAGTARSTSRTSTRNSTSPTAHS